MKNSPLNHINISGIVSLILVFSTAPVWAKEYYVDIQGSDRGQGTKTSPWRTVNKALLSVTPNQGYTIRVGKGTFYLRGTVSVPSGINLIGSGVDSTTIKGELLITGVKKITISNMNFHGNYYTYKLGIYVRDAEQLIMENLAFNGYAHQAMNFDRVTDSNISHIVIRDSSYNNRVAGQNGKQSSAFVLGNLTNVDIHDIDIDTRERGGSGIKTISDRWPKHQPWSGPPSILKNVRFYNLDIKVDKWNAWKHGWTPQMALEIWHTHCVPCEISYSNFNSTLSLVAFRNSQPPGARVRVHHNLWYGDNPFYALEVGTDNIEFDHNYIRGGSYPIAAWGHDPRNLNVHHNIFENTKGPTLIGHFRVPLSNFKFVNNTVYINNSKTRIFHFMQGERADQQISNNIFYNSSFQRNNFLSASKGVRYNIFFNIKPVGTLAFNLDPIFQRFGTQPSPYYIPTGLTGLAADMGAILPNGTPWTVGKQD